MKNESAYNPLPFRGTQNRLLVAAVSLSHRKAGLDPNAINVFCNLFLFPGTVWKQGTVGRPLVSFFQGWLSRLAAVLRPWVKAFGLHSAAFKSNCFSICDQMLVMQAQVVSFKYHRVPYYQDCKAIFWQATSSSWEPLFFYLHQRWLVDLMPGLHLNDKWGPGCIWKAAWDKAPDP